MTVERIPDRASAPARVRAVDDTRGAAAPWTRRLVVAAGVLALSGGAWVAVGVLGGNSAMSTDFEHALTMGMGSGQFTGMWALMMVAMMLPTAVPVLVGVAQPAQGTTSLGASVRTALFAVAYIAAWTAIGVSFYALAVGAGGIASRSTGVADSAGRIAGGVLLLVGVYELSPFKAARLGRCRDVSGLVEKSRHGGVLWGALTGLRYARFCIGCSLPLCVLLFPVGVMSLTAMGLVTVLILVEKTTPRGMTVARLAGFALVIAGAVVVLDPALLPTQVGMGSAM